MPRSDAAVSDLDSSIEGYHITTAHWLLMGLLDHRRSGVEVSEDREVS